MKVKLSDIKVRNRIRKDLGNIEALSDSLNRHGLFSPILITSDYRLIAGERRLEAAKRFTEAELNEGYERIHRLKNPTLKQRIANFFRRIFAFLFRRRKKQNDL